MSAFEKHNEPGARDEFAALRELADERRRQIAALEGEVAALQDLVFELQQRLIGAEHVIVRLQPLAEAHARMVDLMDKN